MKDTGTRTNGYKLATNKFARKLLEGIQTEEQGFYPSCISRSMLLRKSQKVSSVLGTTYLKGAEMLETPRKLPTRQRKICKPRIPRNWS